MLCRCAVAWLSFASIPRLTPNAFVFFCQATLACAQCQNNIERGSRSCGEIGEESLCTFVECHFIGTSERVQQSTAQRGTKPKAQRTTQHAVCPAAPATVGPLHTKQTHSIEPDVVELVLSVQRLRCQEGAHLRHLLFILGEQVGPSGFSCSSSKGGVLCLVE